MELCVLIMFISLIITAIIAFVMMFKVLKLRKDMKEKQSLIKESRKSLKEAEEKVEQRTKFIKDLQQANREQRETIEEQDVLIDTILDKTIKYMPGHERKMLDVIKETIRDYRQPNIKKEVITSNQTTNNF